MQTCTCEHPDLVPEEIKWRGFTRVENRCLKCGYFYDESAWEFANRQRNLNRALTGKTKPKRKRSRRAGK